MECKDLTASFMDNFQTKKPKSGGWVFLDGYLDSNFNWQPEEATKCSNVYDYRPYHRNPQKAALNEEFFPGWKVSDYKRQLSGFLRAMYYKRDDLFKLKMIFWLAASAGVSPGKALVLCSVGGSGKGADFMLDQCFYGQGSCATVKGHVFTNLGEWYTNNIISEHYVKFISKV